MPSGTPAWLFRDTGLAKGARVARLIHGEYDRVYRNVPEPPRVTLVAHTPMPCGSFPMEQPSPQPGNLWSCGTTRKLAADLRHYNAKSSSSYGRTR